MELINTTYHGFIRAKERMGLSDKRALKEIQNALLHGKCAESFSSWERNYLLRENVDNCCAIAYNGYCYILNESGYCITVYALPVWFGKKKRFDGKERIRNMKKYERNHCVYDTGELQY